MPIVEITEEVNKSMPKTKPIKEKMDKYVPDIIDGVARRNGTIALYVGSGGSGKTSYLLNQMKTVYKKKFHHIYYFCPSSSFASVKDHAFAKHDKVYHELDADTLEEIKSELTDRKDEAEDGDEQEYSLIIIDDFANNLKDKLLLRTLNSMLIKARHLNAFFIFTVQSYLYFAKILRKQLTWCSIFSGVRNKEEWRTIREELLKMNEEDDKKLYDYVFDVPYNHLDLDLFEEKIYKNGNLLDIREKE
jgi:hypothetical protein